jgi:hypothetical protein
MFCEHCGLQIFPNRPVCTRCGESPTLHWLQFTSLLTLLIAVVCNSLLAWYLLPRFTASHHAPLFFRAWLWTSEKASLYGWAPVAAGLLAWDYFVWRKSRPKVKGWFTRKVLTFVLVASVTPILPWWIPAGPSQTFLSNINALPGLPSVLAWISVLIVIAWLCANGETRNALLGQGRVLSLLSLGALVLLLAMTAAGWTMVAHG